VKLDNWETTADLNPIYADIRRLGLEQNIAEHDAFGFTIVPPEKVGPPKLFERLRQALLDVHFRRTGQRLQIEDLASADLRDSLGAKPTSSYWKLIGEDPVFEEAVMNPVVHTLARYFLGKSVIVSEILGLLKQADPAPTHMLHTDQHGTPPPLPQYPQFLNITWALTDYTKANGALAIVPGSHRFGRKPEPYESDHLKNDPLVPAIPVECAPGSLIVWGGTTWHGSYPRSAPGIRLTIVMAFVRSYMKTIQDLKHSIPPEVFERNSPEFARFMGRRSAYPVGDGPDMEDTLAFVNAGRTPWS
jgi:hypothetical protein